MIRRRGWRAAALLAPALAACSAEPGRDDAAAYEATPVPNGSDDTRAAETTVATSATPARPPLPAPTREVVSEAPVTVDGAEGAAEVVRSYYALLAAKRYEPARRLLRPGSAVAGRDASTFARRFARSPEYDAEVGAPGRVEAGAGQRYVTVPILLRGTTRAGRAFERRGTVTLHRAGDIDGATAEQRSWRIETIALEGRGDPGD